MNLLLFNFDEGKSTIVGVDVRILDTRILHGALRTMRFLPVLFKDLFWLLLVISCGRVLKSLVLSSTTWHRVLLDVFCLVRLLVRCRVRKLWFSFGLLGLRIHRNIRLEK